jgi:hypothetical protein
MRDFEHEIIDDDTVRELIEGRAGQSSRQCANFYCTQNLAG